MKIGKNICNSNIVEAKSFHIALLCDCFCQRLNPRLLAPSPKLRAELCHEITPRQRSVSALAVVHRAAAPQGSYAVFPSASQQTNFGNLRSNKYWTNFDKLAQRDPLEARRLLWV